MHEYQTVIAIIDASRQICYNGNCMRKGVLTPTLQPVRDLFATKKKNRNRGGVAKVAERFS